MKNERQVVMKKRSCGLHENEIEVQINTSVVMIGNFSCSFEDVFRASCFASLLISRNLLWWYLPPAGGASHTPSGLHNYKKDLLE